MKKILMLIYAACAMLVIIGSLLWFGFTLRSDSLQGKTEALKHFKVFTQRTAEAYADQLPEDDSILLQTKLEQLCRNYQKYIRTVLIRDSAGVLFSWPQNADIFSYTEQRVVTVKNLPLFFTAAQMHIPVQNPNMEITVHAALQTVPVETVFNRGRVVFFLLLLIVVLTIAALIFSYIDFKGEDKVTQSAPARYDSPLHTKTGAEDSVLKETSGADFVQTARTAPADQAAGAVAVNTGISSEKSADADSAATAAPIKTDSSLPLSAQLESLNRLHIYENNHTDDVHVDTAQSVSAVESNNKAAEPMEKPAENVQLTSSHGEDMTVPAFHTANEKHTTGAIPPRALNAENYGSFENYSQMLPKESSEPEDPPVLDEPVTEIYPDSTAAHSLAQATIIEDLTTAITETSVAEEDLTLLFIHAPGIAQNQQLAHLLRGTLERIHKAFTFNQDTLGLIIFYASLDQGMQIANHLYDEVYAVLTEPAEKKLLRIGLTTRAGRLIPANRMIEEACAAVAKAIQEDTDPIVAFRVNPEKYRRCLARLT